MPPKAHRLATVQQAIELLEGAISALSKHQRAETPSWPARSRVLERRAILVEVDSDLAHLVITEIELGRRDATLEQSAVRLVPQIHIVPYVLLPHVILKHALLLNGLDMIRVESRFKNGRAVLVHRVIGIERCQVGNFVAGAPLRRRTMILL